MSRIHWYACFVNLKISGNTACNGGGGGGGGGGDDDDDDDDDDNNTYFCKQTLMF